jgi:hypothetical protein
MLPERLSGKDTDIAWRMPQSSVTNGPTITTATDQDAPMVVATAYHKVAVLYKLLGYACSLTQHLPYPINNL